MSIVLLVFIIAGVWWFNFYFKKLPAEVQKKHTQRIWLYGLIAVIFGLIATGRISFIYAAIIGLVPWFERAVLFKSLYDKFSKNSENANQKTNDTKSANQNMSVEDARNILGIDKPVETMTNEDIRIAYKKLIQKNHPDSGGSEYIAQQIIEAKNVLTSFANKKG